MYECFGCKRRGVIVGFSEYRRLIDHLLSESHERRSRVNGMRKFAKMDYYKRESCSIVLSGMGDGFPYEGFIRRLCSTLYVPIVGVLIDRHHGAVVITLGREEVKDMRRLLTIRSVEWDGGSANIVANRLSDLSETERSEVLKGGFLKEVTRATRSWVVRLRRQEPVPESPPYQEVVAVEQEVGHKFAADAVQVGPVGAHREPVAADAVQVESVGAHLGSVAADAEVVNGEVQKDQLAADSGLHNALHQEEDGHDNQLDGMVDPMQELMVALLTAGLMVIALRLQDEPLRDCMPE